jgi:hypothetical protein
LSQNNLFVIGAITISKRSLRERLIHRVDFQRVITPRGSGTMAKNFSFTTFDDPADTITPTFTNLLGINDEGLIAGFYGSGNMGDPNQGFLLTPSSDTFTAVPFPPSSQNPLVHPGFPAVQQVQLTGLNDDDIVVGYFYNTNNGVPVDNQFGFFEKNGVFTEVDNPNTPGLFGNPGPNANVLIENQLIGVNDHDIAVGFYLDKFGTAHGYTYDINTGAFSANIDDPNANSGAPGGTVAAAINNFGNIAGFYTDKNGSIHGFLDNNGVFTTVDAPHASETELLGLNDLGIAVGFDIVKGKMHGIIYNTNTHTFTTLNGPHAVSTTLNGINDEGEIVGFYSTADGNTHGLLATPHDIVKLIGVMEHPA